MDVVLAGILFIMVMLMLIFPLKCIIETYTLQFYDNKSV